MDDKKQFLKLLSPVRRQLRLARVFTAIQYGFASAAAACVAVFLIARIVVFPYYNQAAAVCSLLALSLVFLFFMRRLPGWKDAAEIYNGYVPEDRVLSAHSFHHEDGVIQKLLIKETVSYMKREQEHVLSRKKKYRITKWFAAGILLAAAAMALDQVPNKKIELAEKRQTELAVLKKAEKELAGQIKKEKNPLTKKELEELKKELAMARTPDEALKAIDRKRKELALKELKEKEKTSGLESLVTELEEAGLEKLASSIDEKDVDKALEEIRLLSKNGEKRSPAQSAAMKKLTGTAGSASEEKLDSLQKKLEETFQAESDLKELAAVQEAISKQGEKLQNEMSSNGLSPGRLAMGPQQNSPNGQTQSGNNQGKTAPINNGAAGSQPGSKPQNGTSPGTGLGKDNGNGIGQGNGTGQGTGTGQGSGTGSGLGQGGSTGMGAGLGNGAREFLTVPDKIGGNEVVESDYGKLGGGSPSQFESDGPVQRGTIRAYEDVYGEYAASYRNSLDRMKLPGSLEHIVKNYFSDMDPEKE
ncbi:hypothetical protein [Bacillus sp. FJAT-27445]|uniref:hypothetical protein n=1 Tax=Bacillus sp. FJAT-27445 TaxID=1679166 RepID=UPI000743E112|nr:hypothetical protein [Bacillus sp. FJAT-27445]